MSHDHNTPHKRFFIKAGNRKFPFLTLAINTHYVLVLLLTTRKLDSLPILFIFVFVVRLMEKFNFVKDGAIKLPPGFRFQPTDEEIVFQYLIRKTFSCPLPASIIPEINISNHEPWDLPGK